MADKTWKVLRFECRRPEGEIALEMTCPECGHTATLPMMDPGNPVIASLGLSVVFDDPSYKPTQPFMPEEIQCRSCHKIFSGEN